MEQRMVDFIAALRTAGVRVSIAESSDAFRAVEQVGVMDRDTFRSALRTTLVKEASDLPAFEQLFTLYFAGGEPPLINPQEHLTPEQRAMLAAALRALLSQMQGGDQPSDGRQSPGQSGQLGQLLQLLRHLLSGQALSQQTLEQVRQQAALPMAPNLAQHPWLTRRMLGSLGWEQLEQLLEQLWRELSRAGMGPEAIEQLQRMVQANQEALAEQVGQYAGESLARQMTSPPPPRPGPDLMQRPFRDLSQAEAEELRAQIRRLTARLRSRAALRYKRARSGVLDAKKTIRANLRYGGVPLDLRHKHRHLKPRLAIICDISTSVRHCAEFMLRMIYELQDQVAKTRSFAFISDIQEISQEFAVYQPQVAMERVLTRMPPGHYNTDLGYSLNSFCHDYLDALDYRTTVIFVGDARNNFNDPRLDLFQTIKRRARRIIWLNPEPPHLWGTGDSDALEYLPLCDATYEVSNLAQLTEAVDRLFTNR
ncbi:MAG: VWA domain-containing protein [Anaerolineae bacterium]